MRPEFDPDTYNTLGQHLPNDAKQSRIIMWAMVPATLGCILFLLWMIYWQPVK